MPAPRPVDPLRRRLLLGALAAPLAGSAAATVLPATAAGVPTDRAEAPPECLADLIASGEVTRADLVAR